MIVRKQFPLNPVEKGYLNIAMEEKPVKNLFFVVRISSTLGLLQLTQP
jgi:hypothetical protein